ncbi:hypothetical protein HDU85_006045 [Gaertneriomyces sp. JEL0708]|nr:hypothetical protein HDU85_006045 [Gaertneriomyces sp. JEL0708]
MPNKIQPNWKSTFDAFDGDSDRLRNRNAPSLNRTLPNAEARRKLATDPNMGTFNSSRNDGHPLSNDGGSANSARQSAIETQTRRLTSMAQYRELNGGVVPKDGEEVLLEGKQQAAVDAQIVKLEGYKEIDGGIVPKSADEAALATSSAAFGQSKPVLVKEEDAAHRDEWAGGDTDASKKKSKL